ncbi:MAG: aminopeptidase [Desulfobacterales bacterium]|nr:MAG: aminopeptidase [Desulfobacterales bacterium]
MVLQSKRVEIFGMSLFVAIVLWGCQSLGYYGQAIRGHLRLLSVRQPIPELLADPHTPLELKRKFEHILEIRNFARQEMHLPVDNHYLDYVDVERPFVIWNVFATPEFALKPKTWCYPIAGCAPYRGFFSEKDARRYAAALESEGWDVWVGGVSAYSTLGWFDDPLLSTFLNRSDRQLAALIFHELAHQKLYTPGDSTFNESFATAVEQEGLRRWQGASNHSPGHGDYLRVYQREQQIMDLITHCRRRLEALYRQDLAPYLKRDQKASLFRTLIEDYRQLRESWQGFGAYDAWFSSPLNNAKITHLATYHDLVPAFLQLMQKGDGDLNRFYQECRNLAQVVKGERHRRLREYLMQ